MRTSTIHPRRNLVERPAVGAVPPMQSAVAGQISARPVQGELFLFPVILAC